MTPTRLTATDFFDGLVSALVLLGKDTISLRGPEFDRAVESAFNLLVSKAEENRLQIKFRIRTHSIHGDSLTLRNAVADSAQRDIIGLDNPEFLTIRPKLSAQEAKEYLGSIPGGQELYVQLANEFLNSCRASA